MNDARRLAALLFEDSLAAPAAILVAMIDDPQLEVLPGDERHLVTLAWRGCLGRAGVTPIGQRVGLVLRTEHGMRAWSREDHG